MAIFKKKRLQAGMTVEGSLVLPLFLFYMMTVLLSLEAVRFQSQVQEALHQAGNRAAYTAYQVKYENGNKTDVQRQIRDYLEDQIYPYLCVKNGEEGVRIEELSAGSGDEVEFRVSYRLKPFVELLPIGGAAFSDAFYSHGWTGYSGAVQWGSEEVQETYVYVTRTGSRYHRDRNCTYLQVRIRAVPYEQVKDLRSADGGKYYACERCKPEYGGMVYLTPDGGSFHGRSDCSSLKRTVYMISLSEAAVYQPCSKCGG